MRKKYKESLNQLKSLAYQFKPRILFVAMDKRHNLYFYTNDKQLRHLNLKKIIKKERKLHPLLDIKVFKEKLIILNNTLAWDLKGNREEKDYLRLDPTHIFNAPIIEESIEKVLHWGHLMKKFKPEKENLKPEV